MQIGVQIPFIGKTCSVYAGGCSQPQAQIRYFPPVTGVVKALPAGLGVIGYLVTAIPLLSQKGPGKMILSKGRPE